MAKKGDNSVNINISIEASDGNVDEVFSLVSKKSEKLGKAISKALEIDENKIVQSASKVEKELSKSQDRIKKTAIKATQDTTSAFVKDNKLRYQLAQELQKSLEKRERIVNQLVSNKSTSFVGGSQFKELARELAVLDSKAKDTVNSLNKLVGGFDIGKRLGATFGATVPTILGDAIERETTKVINQVLKLEKELAKPNNEVAINRRLSIIDAKREKLDDLQRQATAKSGVATGGPVRVSLPSSFERTLVEAYSRSGGAIQSEFKNIGINASREMEKSFLLGSRNFSQSVERVAKEATTRFSTIFSANFFADVAFNALRQTYQALQSVTIETVKYAARTEELNIVMESMAKANNINIETLRQQEVSMKRLGITTQDTRETLAKFIAVGFDTKTAGPLARVAQDLAVLSGKNTSDAVEGLVIAIQTLQSRNLRSEGVFLTVDEILDRLSNTTGRARDSFSTLEKQQAVLNATLEYGSRVAGTYEAAMTSASKQLRSMDRFWKEAQNAIGEAWVPAMLTAVTVTTEFLKAVAAYPETFRSLISLVGAFTISLVILKTQAIVGLAASLASLKAGLISTFSSGADRNVLLGQQNLNKLKREALTLDLERLKVQRIVALNELKALQSGGQATQAEIRAKRNELRTLRVSSRETSNELSGIGTGDKATKLLGGLAIATTAYLAIDGLARSLVEYANAPKALESVDVNLVKKQSEDIKKLSQLEKDFVSIGSSNLLSSNQEALKLSEKNNLLSDSLNIISETNQKEINRIKLAENLNEQNKSTIRSLQSQGVEYSKISAKVGELLTQERQRAEESNQKIVAKSLSNFSVQLENLAKAEERLSHIEKRRQIKLNFEKESPGFASVSEYLAKIVGIEGLISSTGPINLLGLPGALSVSSATAENVANRLEETTKQRAEFQNTLEVLKEVLVATGGSLQEAFDKEIASINASTLAYEEKTSKINILRDAYSKLKTELIQSDFSQIRFDLRESYSDQLKFVSDNFNSEIEKAAKEQQRDIDSRIAKARTLLSISPETQQPILDELTNPENQRKLIEKARESAKVSFFRGQPGEINTKRVLSSINTEVERIIAENNLTPSNLDKNVLFLQTLERLSATDPKFSELFKARQLQDERNEGLNVQLQLLEANEDAVKKLSKAEIDFALAINGSVKSRKALFQAEEITQGAADVKKIYELRYKLFGEKGLEGLNIDPRNKSSREEEIKSLERQVRIRDAIKDAEDERLKVLEEITILQKTSVIPLVETELIISRQLLQNTQERRRAEQQLTADIAIEIDKRSRAQAGFNKLVAEVFLEAQRAESSESDNLIKSVLGSQIKSGDASVFSRNPLIREAIEQSKKLSENNKKTDTVLDRLGSTNVILDSSNKTLVNIEKAINRGNEDNNKVLQDIKTSLETKGDFTIGDPVTNTSGLNLFSKPATTQPKIPEKAFSGSNLVLFGVDVSQSTANPLYGAGSASTISSSGASSGSRFNFGVNSGNFGIGSRSFKGIGLGANSFGIGRISSNVSQGATLPVISNSNVGFDSIFNAFVRQESGGNLNAVNRRTSATGLTQIVPKYYQSYANLAGRPDVSFEQYKNSKELQLEIGYKSMKNLYNQALRLSGGDPVEATRMLASRWYSGSFTKYRNPSSAVRFRPNEPSILEYVNQVTGKAFGGGGGTGNILNQISATPTPTFSNISSGDIRNFSLFGENLSLSDSQFSEAVNLLLSKDGVKFGSLYKGTRGGSAGGVGTRGGFNLTGTTEAIEGASRNLLEFQALVGVFGKSIEGEDAKVVAKEFIEDVTKRNQELERAKLKRLALLNNKKIIGELLVREEQQKLEDELGLLEATGDISFQAQFSAGQNRLSELRNPNSQLFKEQVRQNQLSRLNTQQEAQKELIKLQEESDFRRTRSQEYLYDLSLDFYKELEKERQSAEDEEIKLNLRKLEFAKEESKIKAQISKQQDQEREKERQALRERIFLLQRERDTYTGTALQRADIEETLRAQRLEEHNSLVAQIIESETRIANLKENQELRLAKRRQDLLEEEAKRKESNLIKQFELEFELERRRTQTYQSDEFRNGVLENILSNTKTTTELMVGVWNDSFNAINSGFGSLLDKGLSKLGIFGQTISNLLKGIFNNLTSTLFKGLLDKVAPSIVPTEFAKPTGSGNVASAATETSVALTTLAYNAGAAANALLTIAQQSASGALIVGQALSRPATGGVVGGLAGGGLNLGSLLSGSGLNGLSSNRRSITSSLLQLQAGASTNTTSIPGGPAFGYSDRLGLLGLQAGARPSQSVLGGISGAAQQGLVSKLGLKGIGQNLTAALPSLGSSLGGLLGGQSAIGSGLGQIGGGVAGLLGYGLITGGLTGATGGGGLFGATAGLFGLSGAATLGIGFAIAGAFLLGSYLFGRAKRRRIEKKNVNEWSTDALQQMRDLLKGVKSNKIDGEEAMTRSEEIIKQFRENMKTLKTKPGKRLAQEKLSQMLTIQSQIKQAADAQAARRELDERIVPTYATGGVADGDYIRVSRGETLYHPSTLTTMRDAFSRANIPGLSRTFPRGKMSTKPVVQIPGKFDGKDDILVKVPKGTIIANPRQQRIIEKGSYASGGVHGTVAVSAAQPVTVQAPSVNAIIVMSPEEAESLAKQIPNSVIINKVRSHVQKDGMSGLAGDIYNAWSR